MKRSIAAAAMLSASALLLAGCSTASSRAETASSTGVTQAAATSVKNPADLKMAFFSSGTSNEYLKVAIEDAKAVAAKEGFKLDVFDGQWDAKVQFDQMQTALSSGKYNSFAVEAIDGNLVCDLLTKNAPEAGVMVTIFNVPICGRATKSGAEAWEPGTVTFVGGQAPEVYNEWVAGVMAAYPNGAKIALISGPPLSANTINFTKAAEAFKANPKYEIVASQTTDYTTPKAFSAAQSIVQANPGVDVIMSNYTGMTRGVAQATAGTHIAVYDFGGDQWALDNVTSGALAGTVMMLPRQEAAQAVQAVVDHVAGKKVPQFIDLSKSDSLPGTPFVTKANVAKFKAEY
ncbi:sugar ABC transporter substrate-binding protein [Pseudarthrobacter raffinosi]|uniref:sugar ABC transporter substrate-binding protein n=1 Tax=Pseudarthrobacter raffinosi TaxID=2953651 RepID=UPI00208F5117|nr:sugar ABC transporter substrate-binding protein [Pseudarthrobacter sp. MDT3-9]MCO4253534.1 sugar ABC transporter substrate-binding protein [Pseudarthrobacter sp. MDT3-9]